MRFRVLGPVALRAPDWTVPGPGLRSTLLAALLAARGGTVSADALAEMMWGESPGEGARARLQVHVHRLRRLLGDEGALRREGAGYRLVLAPDDLDADAFDELADRALDRQTGPEEVAASAAAALALWHGEPFEGVTGDLVDAEAVRLADRRRAVLEAGFAARLRLGEHREILDEVRSAAAADPLHEGLQVQLMATLAAAGRRSDALAVYRDTRELLVEELGIEPGQQLRSLHEAILLGDEATESDPPRPHQLPSAPAQLVGRQEQLELVDQAIPAGRGGTVVLTGAPGIGKTALALTWAHRHAESFPDGQLYVDLQGFGPGEPLRPERVLVAFLRSLGAPADAHGWPLTEQTTLLRSLTHGRQLLMLLDNAASAEQVRPLLTASAGCTVMITSRLSLSGLALHAGARTIEVPHLTEDLARELLRGALGQESGPEALRPLLECCGGLPLALAIVAERARSTPGVTARGLVAEIAATGARLDRFDLGEEDGSLRSILTWSYQSLSRDAQLIFRTIGAFPGRGPDVGALAAISGVDHRTTARAVDELIRAHLVTSGGVGLGQHDLLRDLAVELAEQEGPHLDQQAVQRLLTYYAVVTRGVQTRSLPDSVPDWEQNVLVPVWTPEFTDDEHAGSWLDHHLRTIVGFADLAEQLEEASIDQMILMLSRAMCAIGVSGGGMGHLTPLVAAASRASKRTGQSLDIVRADVNYGTALAGSGDLERATDILLVAADLALESGHLKEAAIGTGNLGWVKGQNGHHHAALRHYRKACQLATAAGNARGANLWRGNVAAVLLDTEQLTEADECAIEVLAEATRLGADREKAAALAVRGSVALRRGQLGAAARYAGESLACSQAAPLLFRRADAEVLLGSIAAARGATEVAIEHFRAGIGLAQRGGRPDIAVDALLEWADILVRQGSADALSCLTEAADLAHRSGMFTRVEDIRAKTEEARQAVAA